MEFHEFLGAYGNNVDCRVLQIHSDNDPSLGYFVDAQARLE